MEYLGYGNRYKLEDGKKQRIIDGIKGTESRLRQTWLLFLSSEAYKSGTMKHTKPQFSQL